MNNQNYSIIIPAFNEEKSIKGVIENIKKHCTDHEIIVIDDGSSDKTYDVINSLGVKTIRHSFNKGYGAALKTGIRHASSDTIVLMDADDQHDPGDIKKLLNHIGEAEMVVGARTQNSKKSLFRQPGKKLLAWFANYLAGTKIPDLNSGFRAIKKEVALKFMHILPNSFSFTTTITLALYKEGYNIKYVPIETKARVGRSSVNWFTDGLKTILLILRTIMLFSPLKIFLPINIFFAVAALSYLSFDLIFFQNISDTSVILILFTVLIFLFGLLADQLAHIRRQIGTK